MSDEPLPTTVMQPADVAPVWPTQAPPTPTGATGLPTPTGSSPWSSRPVGAAQVTAGSLIARTFQIWWRHLVPFALLSLAALAPLVAGFALAGFPLAFLTGGTVPPEEFPGVFQRITQPLPLTTMGLGLLLSAVLFNAQYGGVMHGVARHLSGGTAEAGDMLRQGFRRFWATLGTNILFALAVWVGLLLLVVPGLMAGAALAVAVPAAVSEGQRPVAALRRSRALTRGRRWALVGAFVVVMAVSTGLKLGSNLLSLAWPLGGTLFSLAISVAVNALGAVLPAVAFHDLRAAAEGPDASSLARVFE